jgi:hypothetical protein
VQETLRRYGLEPAWLELEITESTLMNNIDRVIGIMDRITELGVTLSLDDFGTGYSSLSYLKRFPIDTLKIDRSFTTGIPSDANDCAIASTIISIAQQLKHKVIAEGVETVEQLAFLKSSGCDEVQGYLFSQPLPAADFERALKEIGPRPDSVLVSTGGFGIMQVPRKRGRVVEGSSLENCRRLIPFVSSNLTASAKYAEQRASHDGAFLMENPPFWPDHSEHRRASRIWSRVIVSSQLPTCRTTYTVRRSVLAPGNISHTFQLRRIGAGVSDATVVPTIFS